MPTFSKMKESVSKRVLDPNNTSISVGDVGESINDAIKYWKYTRFWFNAVSDSATLTTGNKVIPLPDNFLCEIKDNPFRIHYSTMYYYMEKKDPFTFDNWLLDNGQGIPRIYTNRAGVYECYPIPDQDYEINRYYLTDYADLVNDDDSNDFTTYADQLIIYWALSKLYAERRQDDKMEAYYTGRAANELLRLTDFTAKKESPDTLTINSFLM